MGTRRVSAALWLVAFCITVVLAVFQRMTGPSHPARGLAVAPAGDEIRYRLPRSHGGDGGLEVRVEAPERIRQAFLEWRRFPTDEAWQSLVMTRAVSGSLAAVVPHQPPAGKVEYRLLLDDGVGTVVLPVGEPVVARFRADVPAWVLIPHILAMFGSMLVATRTLLEVLRPTRPEPRVTVLVAMALLAAGGLVLGPIVQKFAFGAFWTGWPFGHDLTDNKTLIALLGWLPATVLALLGRRLWGAVVVGWIVMMGIFLIPHSLRGSEMDWSEGEIRTGAAVGAAPADLAPMCREAS
jgi:hypothetical protein